MNLVKTRILLVGKVLFNKLLKLFKIWVIVLKYYEVKLLLKSTSK